ncbi:MAG: hypothetical protein HY083_03335 [Gammaproteobacteria bacterium]|nr:hypothetical protein [Gammaproteobacteria bacterium]
MLLVPEIRSVLADLNRHHFMRLQTNCGDYTSPDIGAAPPLAATPKFEADVKILSSHSLKSAGQFANLAWTKFPNCTAKCRNKRKKINQSVGPGPKHNDRERPVVEPLLPGKAFVDRDQHIEAPGHRLKQRAIVKISPTHFRSSFNLVLG